MLTDKCHVFWHPAKVPLYSNKYSMSVIYLTLAISVLVALVFFVFYIISVKKGQYEDLYTPSVRILFDDELVEESKENNQSTQIITEN